MTRAALAFSGALALGLALAVQAFENEPDGFRGIAWGTPIADVAHEMTQIGPTRGKMKMYIRRGERLQIGAARLEGIRYFFRDDRLTGVHIRAANTVSDGTALRDAFFATFGTPHKPNRFIERYMWSGAKAHIVLECIAIESCWAAMYSAAGLDAEQRERDAEAANAKKDF